MEIIDINWFKKEIYPKLNGYEINYRYFPSGDFGQLEQIAFDSDKIGGEVEFWSSGRKTLFLIDYRSGETLLNYLFLEHTEEEVDEAQIEKAFDKLKTIILDNRVK